MMHLTAVAHAYEIKVLQLGNMPMYANAITNQGKCATIPKSSTSWLLEFMYTIHSVRMRSVDVYAETVMHNSLAIYQLFYVFKV